MKYAIVILAVLISGCGASRGLKPAAGDEMPPAPYGATTTPTTNDLLTPQTQARPGRSDELLRNSEKRRSDEFDLPPR